MTDYGTIFDEKPDTSAINTIRKLEARIAELEAALRDLLDAWKKDEPLLSDIDHAFHVLEKKP